MQTWYNEVSVFNSASIDTFRWVIFKNISSSSYTNDDHQFCFAVFHLQLFFCSFSPSTFFAVFYLQLFFAVFHLQFFAVFHLRLVLQFFHFWLLLQCFTFNFFWKFFTFNFFGSFSPVTFFCSSSPAGHYTQIVWAETDRLGCGTVYYRVNQSHHILKEAFLNRLILSCMVQIDIYEQYFVMNANAL